jgi:hypothetical protein
MSAMIVTQNAKPVGESSDLLIPQGQIGHQGIDEYEPRPVLQTIDPAAEANAIGKDEAVGSLIGQRHHQTAS